ncbi:MAG: sigma-54-dependent transcriptional regulator [Burkholderiaceae bacterium]
MMHALLVDDDKATANVLVEVLAGEGFTTAIASNLQQAQQRMVEQKPDVALLNIQLPDGNDADDGMHLLRQIVANGISEVVIISRSTGMSWAQVSRMGAFDCLMKPVDIEHLKSILSRVLHRPAFKNSLGALSGQVRYGNYFGRLMGTSAAMQNVYLQIERVAPTSATVFITGESGTGKELVAQTLHDLSRRRAHPFIAVNCGAISPQLIESELFGHEKGSFTGALREHKGYFERANGGTLFLDEITEMSPELQVKLLRVLEARTFMRVGSGREIEIEVRVIAATNRIPKEAVADGKLREDLLYRLQVFPLSLPPLRQREQDVTLLANAYLDELNRAGCSAKTFAPDALVLLQNYHWPGNVRELRNAIHRAYILADDLIDAKSFALQPEKPDQNAGPFIQVRVGSTVAEMERRLILATLEQCQGAKEKAADMLGLSLKTLYNRLREYDSGCDFIPINSPACMPDQRDRAANN